MGSFACADPPGPATASEPGAPTEGEGESEALGEPPGGETEDGPPTLDELPTATAPSEPALPTPVRPIRDLTEACPGAGERFPTEEWISQLASPNEGPRTYVDPGAGPGGDGSRARPFQSLGPTFSDTPPDGMIVVLAAGSYQAGLTLGGPMALIGACPGRTKFIGPPEAPPAGRGVFHIGGRGGAVLANLTIQPSYQAVSVYDPGAPVAFRRVVIDQAVGTAFHVISSEQEVLLEDVRISSPLPTGKPIELGDGYGIVLSGEGPTKLRRVEISDAPHIALNMFGAGRLTASDLWIHHSGEAPVTVGWGISVANGQATLERVEVDGTFDFGILVASADDESNPVLDALDVVVRGITQGPTEVHVVAGIEASEGGSVTVRRALIEDLHDRCLVARRADPLRRASLVAEDVTCRDVTATRFGVYAMGALGVDGVELTLRRARLERIRGFGVLAFTLDGGAGPSVELEDITMRDFGSALNREAGYGMALWDGAQATAARVDIQGVRAGGVRVSGWGRSPETHLRVEDLKVSRVDHAECFDLPADDPWRCTVDGRPAGGGLGMIVNGGGRARMDRFEIRRAAMAGITLSDDAVLRADAGVVTDNPIGLNHLGDPTDLEGWLQDVFVFDNTVDVARENLVLPDPNRLIDR